VTAQSEIQKAKNEPIAMQKEINKLYNAYISSQAEVKSGKEEPVTM